MPVSERRRYVRIKPSLELPVRVALVGDGPLREALDVIDVSVGGCALASPALRDAKLGQRLRMQLALGADEYPVEVVVRWTSGERVGVELVDAPASTSQALSRYIAELLERGAS